MRNRKVIVEIIIDEDNIRDLYPDFDYLYDDVDDFLDHIFDSIETDSEDTLKELGYSVKIMDSISLDHLITFSKN